MCAVVYAPELFDIAFSERPEDMSPPAIPGPELSGDAPPEEAPASRKRSKRAQRIRARAQRALSELDAGTARAAQIPPGYACGANVYRQWIGQMDMYALWNGVWWAGTNTKQNGLNCGG